MAILQTTSTSTPSSFQSTTCQDIGDGTAQDIRQQLSSSAAPGQAILLDYCNRISLLMLRASRWDWLLSPPQHFATELQTTDYWIGATGSAPVGTFDTGLNLTDVHLIRDDSVYDRSNFRQLQRVVEQPLTSRLSFRDDSTRQGRPTVFRHDVFNAPYVLQIFPGADNQNNYQPVPEAPTASTTAGGALASRQYFLKLTLVDSLGNESSGSTTSAEVWVPASKLVVVNPPVEQLTKGEQGIKYGRYNIYASTTLGQEKLQNNSPISTANTWTEPTSGLVTNTALTPSTNSITALNGYVIEFRYYQQRAALTSTSQVLQVPDYYKDIIIAGVNQLAFQFLNRPREAAEWKDAFRSGIIQIIHDKNLFPSGAQFIHPDGAAVQSGIAGGPEAMDGSAFGW